MSGIQFVTDEKGRKFGVLIDLKNTGPAGRTSGTVLCLNRAGRKRAFLTMDTAQPASNALALHTAANLRVTTKTLWRSISARGSRWRC